MMSTRRTLVAFGVLSALVLFGSTPAFAQAPTGVVANVRVATGTTATGSLDVTWEITTALVVGEMIEVQNRQVKTGQAANAGWSDSASPGMTAVKHTFTGLDSSKNYQARARTVSPTGDPSVWVVSSDDGTTADDESMAMPKAAQPPVMVGSPSVTVGDTQLMVEWLKPASEMPIQFYTVYYTPMGGTTMEKIILAPNTSTTLTGLTNDMEYSIQVAAQSSAGPGAKSMAVKATPKAGAGMPMPTPALPLFGILALFGGLLAAGRARLRR